MQTLRSLWEGWKKIAHKIADFQTRVILSVLYILLFPFGLLYSYYLDALELRRSTTSTWTPKKNTGLTMPEVSNQY